MCWRRYKVRPANGAKNPAETVANFCSYDEAHKDYLYTPAWVQFLIEKMKDENEYNSLSPKPNPPRVGKL
ncbi:MAG: hypothetical protein NVSMB28_00350 [Collimonas sp.]